MQPFCTDRMKIARELLDYGILGEGVEKLSRLRDCGQHGGCDHWHRCIRLVERQWQLSKDTSPERSATCG